MKIPLFAQKNGTLLRKITNLDWVISEALGHLVTAGAGLF